MSLLSRAARTSAFYCAISNFSFPFRAPLAPLALTGLFSSRQYFSILARLDLLKVISLPWVEPSVIGQLYCADQQGPHLLLAFFADKEGINTYSAKVVTYNLAENCQELEVYALNSKFNLQLAVSQIQLVLCTMTEYCWKNGEKRHYVDCQISKTRPHKIIPLVIFLFPDGNLMTNLKSSNNEPEW